MCDMILTGRFFRYGLWAFFVLPVLGAATPKPPECSLTVTPRPGVSKVTKSNSGRIMPASGLSSGTGSKSITRSLKWAVETRFRKNRPEKLELKVYYLGYNERNTIVQLGTETKALELDKNGRASLELTSPTTRLVKSRTVSSSRCSGNGAGFRSTKSTTRGERVTGCVIQLFADGVLAKSWTSDPRWSSEAENEDFSVAELNRKKGKIGLR